MRITSNYCPRESSTFKGNGVKIAACTHSSHTHGTEACMLFEGCCIIIQVASNSALYKGLGYFNHILVTSVAFLLCASHIKFKEYLNSNQSVYLRSFPLLLN